MLAPLSNEGIETLYVVKDLKSQIEPELVIDKTELDYFIYQDYEDLLNSNLSNTYVQIESISFKEKNKWKFSNGKLIFNANILDINFLNRINNGELRFGKGDILRVRLLTKQTLVHNKLKSEYEVVEVLEHRIIKGEQENLGI